MPNIPFTFTQISCRLRSLGVVVMVGGVHLFICLLGRVELIYLPVMFSLPPINDSLILSVVHYRALHFVVEPIFQTHREL